MKKPGRNSDCWCGSGRKYKHCHQPIDDAVGPAKYTAAQDVYARNWRPTAQHHFDGGVYHWLSEQLASVAPRRILDVGCGSGHGLLALREFFGPDVTIIALDENPGCLETARRTLLEAGIQSVVVRRMTVTSLGDSYVHQTEPLNLPAASCILAESDVCNDPYLEKALRESGPFDAVTVWLTGSHMLRAQNLGVLRRRIANEGQLRLAVQNATYELADRVLREGGVLQVADRHMSPASPAVEADLLAAHREQAEPTTLRVEALAYRPYTEPSNRKTPMVISPGTSGLLPPTTEPAIVSIISRKA